MCRYRIAIIKNSEDKYLVYFDKVCSCLLFPNYKGCFVTQLIYDLGKDLVWFKFIAASNHQKYSPRYKCIKDYIYEYYDVHVTGLPQCDFISGGKHYCWMSIEEIENDPCIAKCNSDVVNFIKSAH